MTDPGQERLCASICDDWSRAAWGGGCGSVRVGAWDGPALVFRPDEWTGFVRGVVGGRFRA